MPPGVGARAPGVRTLSPLLDVEVPEMREIFHLSDYCLATASNISAYFGSGVEIKQCPDSVSLSNPRI